MPADARARIAIWEGTSIWLGETVRPFSGAQHAHHAIQISFLLSGRIGFGSDGGEFSAPVTLIDSNVPHSLIADGLVAHLFIEPAGRIGRIVRAASGLQGKLGPCTLPGIDGFAETLHRLWHGDASPAEFRRDTAEMLDRLTGAEATAAPLDARVERLLASIERLAAGPLSFEAAASGIHYSRSRLRHLFAEQVGLPFKSYVLWRRLIRALEAITAGASLTAAAHEAGFADAAHFSRAFRRHFGLSANRITHV
jgi:AraC-like DNA-binding protein